MVSVDQLPRDDNGAVRGLWRLYHRHPDYTGQIGMCTFVNGVAQAPLFGVPLQSLVAVIGPDLYMTPWEGPVPGGAALPEVLTYEIPQDALEALDPVPDAYGVQVEKAPETPAERPEPPAVEEPPAAYGWLDEPAPVDDLEAMSKPELFSLALDRGLKPHHRAGITRLRKMIRDDRNRD